jgi:hypothetical protein
MNWFQQNRLLGMFLIGTGAAILVALGLLFFAKSSYSGANDRLNETATELNRLQNLNPFPNPVNLQTTKAQAADYGVALGKVKEELKTRVLPATPMQPNEFQARLREVVTRVVEKARANKVKLPQNFFLGFDEFAAALPSNEATSALGQQLAQVEAIANILIDARVDSITAFKRGPLPEEHVAAATPTPISSRALRPANGATGTKLVERSALDVSFASSSSAARRVLNQIASANQQFFIVRTLHVTNEKDKGPARTQSATQSPEVVSVVPSASPIAKSNAALNFIVGNEHIQTTAHIELVRFTF